MSTQKNMTRGLRSGFVAVLLGLSALTGLAQTPPPTEMTLSQAFAGIRSGDPKAVELFHNGKAALLLTQEMPAIEKDTAAICEALTDKDSFVRLQAPAVLVAIATAAPEHNSVVQACFPNLIKTASDPADQTRNNSLFVLAMNPAGPPPAAHEVFVVSLKSPNYRTQECGAAGLLKEGTNQEANQKLVLQTLDSAPNKKNRLNILYAVTGARVRSDTLFEGVQKYLFDPDNDVQTEAINAVAATGKDHATVASVIQGVVDSPTATKEEKLRARMALGTTSQ